MSELRQATSPEKSQLYLCFPFSPAEFFTAATNLFSSTATNLDKVAYPILKHLPRSGMDFLQHIFNLSWSLDLFSSIWKTSSIIPIHKMASLSTLLLPSALSLSLPAYQSFLKASFYRAYSFFLESNSIPSPRHVGFHPGWSTLDQILYLSHSISDEFNIPKPGSRTILAMTDFSKAFNSDCHPILFNKLISAGLPPYFVRWTQPFLSVWRACVVFQNQKSRSF